MNIRIFSRWNATCGISTHAELLGFEFIKMGHSLKVFAPYIETANKWWHHKIMRNSEEDFVVRCYSELDPETLSGGWIDEDKILPERFDLFIVESYVSIPYKHVEKIVEKVKEKGAKVIVVVHEGKREDLRYSNLSIFDTIVVFDERYLKEMLYDYKDRVSIIPFPCHPVKGSQRKFAEDMLTFFSFGRQPINEYEDYINALDRLHSKYDFVYKIVRSDGLLPYDKPWLKQEHMRLRTEKVYEHLHSSDIHLLPKGKTSYVVVSSTLFECLGSLVPTVVPNTRHFEALPDEKPVVIYDNVEDLKMKLELLIEDEGFRNKVIKAAEKYVRENESEKIARRFIDLYRSL